MHIGFGQNTISSLYGHQKGDYMKNTELSQKKHKANESQEKTTATSGKDVCRKIGHSDEADGENQENAYIHNRFALDAGYANYIRETVPKTTWSKDYLQELWDEETKYLKSIRESKNGYGFDDVGMGAAYAYSTMYQKIVEGYYFLDMSDTEIAKLQNISRSGVFQNRHYALKQMKKSLEEEN